MLRQAPHRLYPTFITKTFGGADDWWIGKWRENWVDENPPRSQLWLPTTSTLIFEHGEFRLFRSKPGCFWSLNYTGANRGGALPFKNPSPAPTIPAIYKGWFKKTCRIGFLTCVTCFLYRGGNNCDKSSHRLLKILKAKSMDCHLLVRPANNFGSGFLLGLDGYLSVLNWLHLIMVSVFVGVPASQTDRVQLHSWQTLSPTV